MSGNEPPLEVPGEANSAGAQAVVSRSWRPDQRPLLDRQSERRAIDDMLRGVGDGFSGLLVLRGGYGVGKTALLDYAINAATGFQVLTVAGAQSELAMGYGAVHQLHWPLFPLVKDLPVPQRDAMKMAYGLEPGPRPDPYLVGLACLTLVSRAAEAAPVLCAIDDAHWIDAESAQVTSFVARRLYADRVGMICTVSDIGAPAVLDEFPNIEVGGLPDTAGAELLRSVVQVPLEPQVISRVLADTGGNARALVEIGSHFSSQELAERASRPEPLPIGRQLQQRYLRRVERLPADAQQFLVLIAAEGSGNRGLVRQVAADAGIDVDAAESTAEAAELIEVSGNSVRFCHPQVRAAAYNGAPDADRRRAHERLAQMSASADSVGRREWHRAAAAAEPDEDVAGALQSAAERASQRGAGLQAAAFLRRSIDLTPDDNSRARREVALAETELVIGHPETARQIADEASPRLLDVGARGRARMLSGEALSAQGRDGEAAGVLAEASAALTSDRDSATDALLMALRSAMRAGSAESRGIATAASAQARDPQATSAPRVSELLLTGLRARFTSGYDTAAAPLHAALEALRRDDLDQDDGLRWFGLGASVAGSLWDDQALLDITDRWERLTRRLGALTYLPMALTFMAFADWLTGRLDQATDRWTEMRELMAASQRRTMIGVDGRSEALLLAYRGDTAAARTAGKAQVRQASAGGQDGLADSGRSIMVVANLFDGDCEAAADAAVPILQHDAVFTAEQTLPEVVEAAVCSGNYELASDVFATLSSRTAAAGTPWALGLRARCEALISKGEEAERSHLDAISQLGRSRAIVDLARAHLLYGQWLRRAKRRRDARRQLRTAEDMYQAMGANGFVARARDELRASGERARSRTPETEFDLTPQESRVAGLAVEGATNGEIAERLFISPSTVEYHLAKVFRKLGVRSRNELGQRLRPL